MGQTLPRAVSFRDDSSATGGAAPTATRRSWWLPVGAAAAAAVVGGVFLLLVLRRRRQVSVVVLGEPGGGKTTLARTLVHGAPPLQAPPPTIGVVVFACERLAGLQLKIFDISAPTASWARAVYRADVIVMPVNPAASDPERLADAEQCLCQQPLADIPLFVALIVNDPAERDAALAFAGQRVPALCLRPRTTVTVWSAHATLGLAELEQFIVTNSS